MTTVFDDTTRHRFLRTLRVATGVAVAGYHEARDHGALAAKGGEGWRFPETGLLSADGLVLATLMRAPGGAPARLDLQAQGSTGLATFAGRTVRIALADRTLGEAAFDRLGRLRLDLPADGLSEESLAAFELRFEDEAS